MGKYNHNTIVKVILLVILVYSIGFLPFFSYTPVNLNISEQTPTLVAVDWYFGLLKDNKVLFVMIASVIFYSFSRRTRMIHNTAMVDIFNMVAISHYWIWGWIIHYPYLKKKYCVGKHYSCVARKFTDQDLRIVKLKKIISHTMYFDIVFEKGEKVKEPKMTKLRKHILNKNYWKIKEMSKEDVVISLW